MNIEARPIVVYPKIHGMQTELDSIDHSIYHLLSLYSNENVLKKNCTTKKKPLHPIMSFQHKSRSWLGETKPTPRSRKRVTFSKVVTIIPFTTEPSVTLFEGDIYVDAREHLG